MNEGTAEMTLHSVNVAATPEIWVAWTRDFTTRFEAWHLREA